MPDPRGVVSRSVQAVRRAPNYDSRGGGDGQELGHRQCHGRGQGRGRDVVGSACGCHGDGYIGDLRVVGGRLCAGQGRACSTSAFLRFAGPRRGQQEQSTGCGVMVGFPKAEYVKASKAFAAEAVCASHAQMIADE
eukprot:14264937-Alexandrium_andersonii.AAC.1